MKKVFFLFLVVANFSFAQNFPYLNASTGNPDFFTDSDTNMYITHGNRLVKADKNFNTVWANNYGTLNFKKILLSKTGSMYFIATIPAFPTQYLVGKAEANGNISWLKSTTGMTVSVAGSTVTTASLNSESLFLDSNNNLLVSGVVSPPASVCLIKMDTTGNIIKARLFSISDYTVQGGSAISVNILNEVSGTVNLITTGAISGGAVIVMDNFSYSNVADSVTYANQSGLAGCTNCTSTFKFIFYKSKTRSDVFYLFGDKFIDYPSPGATPYHFILRKYTFNGLHWNQEYNWSAAPATMSKALDEDEKGNIFCVVNPGNSISLYHSGVVKFDSTGACNGSWNKYFNGYNYNNGITYPNDRVNVLYSNKLFMNVTGAGYPTNSLTIEPISPSLTMSCSNTVSLNQIQPSFSATLPPVQSPAQYNVINIILANISSTVTTINNFSMIQNFCATVGVSENTASEELSIYPNPVTNKLIVRGESIKELIVLDQLGRTALSVPGSEADVSLLSPGVYMVCIHTIHGFVNKKFLKQ